MNPAGRALYTADRASLQSQRTPQRTGHTIITGQMGFLTALAGYTISDTHPLTRAGKEDGDSPLEAFLRFGLPFLSREILEFLLFGFLSGVMLLLPLPVLLLPFIMLGLMTEGSPPARCMVSVFIVGWESGRGVVLQVLLGDCAFELHYTMPGEEGPLAADAQQGRDRSLQG